MAIYTGIGYDSTNFVTVTSTSADTVDFAGNVVVDGNLSVTGNLISTDELQVLVKDNFLDLNFGNTSTTYSQSGLTINYKANIADVEAGGSFIVTQANLVGAVSPTGTVVITNNTNVTAGDTVTIQPQGGGAGVVFTATASGTPTASEFTIGGNDIGTAGNLATQINANANFSAQNGGTNTVTITYPTKSATGNANTIVVSDVSAMSKTDFASGVDGTTITLQKADSSNVVFTGIPNADGASGNEFRIGTDDATAATNIANAINGNADFTANVDGGDDNKVDCFLVTGGAGGNAKSISTSTATAIGSIEAFGTARLGISRAVITVDTSANNATFSARSGTTRPKLEFAGTSTLVANTFAVGDLIAISGTTNGENDGIYVVQAQSTADEVSVENANAGDTIQSAFVVDDFTAVTQTTGNIIITNVDLLALRSSNTGGLQSASGSTDDQFATGNYTDVGAGSVGLQTAYDNDPSVVTASSTNLSITTTSGNFAVEGGGSVAFGQTTSLATFLVDTTGLIDIHSDTNITLDIGGTDLLALGASGVTIGSDFLPDSDDAHDLGVTGTTFKDAYLSGNLIYEGATTENGIVVPTNLAVALSIGDTGSATMLEVISTTSEDRINFSGTRGISFASETTYANSFIDENDFATNVDANAIASAESIKAYVDNRGQNSNFVSLPTLVADAGGITLGDVVAIDSSGLATKANAGSSGDQDIVGIALNTATVGNPVYIANQGELSSLTFLGTPSNGSQLFLSTTDGRISGTAPSSSGDTIYQVGFQKSAGTIIIALRHIMVLG